MSSDRPNLSGIFWGAVPAPSDERTPEAVVRQALLCIRAFEEGEVRNRRGGAPLSLMELLADLGIEEDLVYASPELVRGETLDERSLVFTIGVLVFERLTDRHPFGTTESGRLARLRRGEMGSGVNYFPSVPKQLRTILMRAMGPFPEERYRGLGAMKKELAAFVGHPSLATSSPATHEPPQARPGFFEATTTVDQPPAAKQVAFHEAKTEALGGLEELDTAPEATDEAGGKKRAFHEAKTELNDQADPRFDTTEYGPGANSVSSGEIVAPPAPRRPGPPAQPTATVVEPHQPEPAMPGDAGVGGARAHRPTHRIGAVARPGNKIAPLLYVGVGILIASVAFLIFGRAGDRGPVSPPSTEGPATVDKAAATPVVTKPVVTKPTTTKPAPSAKALPAVSAAAGRSARAATVSPPRAVSRQVASRALHGGRQVLKAIDACHLPQNGRPFRISVFAQPSGRAIRAFVAARPWLSRAMVRCIRRALPGTALGLTLRRADFVEWSFRVHPDGRYEIKLVRPKVLLGPDD